MRRKKEPQNHENNLGGHMPNPPEDCPAPIKITREAHGITTIWVDSTFCMKYCYPKFCTQAEEHFERCKKEYKEALERSHKKEQE